MNEREIFETPQTDTQDVIETTSEPSSANQGQEEEPPVKKAKKGRKPLSASHREQLKANLAKGRLTSLRNRQLKAEAKKTKAKVNDKDDIIKLKEEINDMKNKNKDKELEDLKKELKILKGKQSRPHTPMPVIKEVPVKEVAVKAAPVKVTPVKVLPKPKKRFSTFSHVKLF
jgi:hypothetical protein